MSNVPSLLGQNSATAAASTVSVSVTVPSGGGYLWVIGTTGAAPSNFSSVTDSSGSSPGYTQKTSSEDTVNVQSLASYISNAPAPAGTYNVTLNLAAGTAGFNGIAVYLIPNTTGNYTSQAGNYQPAPGTGVTTGASGVLPGQPAVAVGATITTSGAASITAGSGFTQLGSTVWGTLKANFCFVEYQLLAATTSLSSTFTSANGNPQVSVGGVWLQPLSGGTQGGLDGGLNGGLTGGFS
jgi:hypothetical protein